MPTEWQSACFIMHLKFTGTEYSPIRERYHQRVSTKDKELCGSKKGFGKDRVERTGVQ